MARLHSTLLFVILFFLQVSFLGNLRIFYVVPNLLLVALVYFAFQRDIKEVILYAMVFGFFLDLIISFFFGLNLIFFFLLSWAVYWFSKEGKFFSFFRVIVVILGTSVLYSFFLIIGLYLKGTPLDLGIFFIFLMQASTNVFFGAILFIPFLKYFEFLKKIDNYSKQKVQI